MDTIIKFFLYFMVGMILLSLLTNILVYGGLIYLTYFVVKKTVAFIKQKHANQKLVEATKVQSDTLACRQTGLSPIAASLRHVHLDTG